MKKISMDTSKLAKTNEHLDLEQLAIDAKIANSKHVSRMSPPSMFDDVIAADIFYDFEPPAFPVDALPIPFQAFVADQSELMGTDPALMGVAALAAAAACLDDRIQIQPKRFVTKYRESARLWVAPIGPPSTKKSPGISAALAPLKKINAEWLEEWGKIMCTYSKASKEAKARGDDPPPWPSNLRRLIVSDATTEALGKILNEAMPRGVLVYRDELSGWIGGMDAYKSGGKSVDRPVWLEAYNGGSQQIDRIGRGHLNIENFSVTLIGGIQPQVIETLRKSTDEDGLWQRFIIVKVRKAVAEQDRVPDEEAARVYEQILRTLSDIKPPVNFLDQPVNVVVKLSDEAHAIREERAAFHLTIANEHPNQKLSAAAGKWSGLFARLLLVYHCIEVVADGAKFIDNDVLVSGATAGRVARLMRDVIIPNALSFYSDADASVGLCRDMAATILAKGWERFTVKRQLNRSCKSAGNATPFEHKAALSQLETFGWIQADETRLDTDGRPVGYSVNPEVGQKFRQRREDELKRRELVSEAIAQNVADIRQERE